MTHGPIPWSSVVKWGELHGFNDLDDLDVLLHHTRAMENAENNFHAQRNKGKENKGRKS
jgi:hypothetical protein